MMQSLPVYTHAPRMLIEDTPPALPNSACTACSLARKGTITVCMPAEIAGQSSEGYEARVYVIGQGPQDADDRAARPFASSTGQYVRTLIERSWHGEVVYDNAVRCAPGATKLTDSMLKACRPYVAQSLRDARPARILCLGTDAIKAVMGRGFATLSTRRGYTYLSSGTPVFFLIPPSSAMRNRFLRGWFEQDLQWALTAAPPFQPPLNATARMIESDRNAQHAASIIRMAGGFTFDIETFGAPFNRDFRILNLAATPYGSDFAFVWEEAQLANPTLNGGLFRLFRDETIKKCGHNAKFDMIGLRARFGVQCSGLVEDTRLWRKLLEADVETRLETAQTLVGMAGGKDEAGAYVKSAVKEINRAAKMLERYPGALEQPTATQAAVIAALQGAYSGFSSASVLRGLERVVQGDEPLRYAYAAIPPAVRSRYNAADTISTDRLRRHYAPLLEQSPGVAMIWRDVTHPMQHAVTAMEFNGIQANRAAISRLQREMTEVIEQARAELRAYGDFNPNASGDVSALLFDKLGLQSDSTTATGRRSTDAGTLQKLRHPVADAILRFRKASKFKTQYADGMLAHIQDDGRIHPAINLDGTETGRPSCQNPNLLNIPRAGTAAGKLCRNVFTAAEGHILIEADQSQIELRVAAMLSEDQAMTDLFLQKVDFHLGTARLIAPLFNIDPAALTKAHDLRDKAKVVNFSTLYGDPPYGLAMKLGISKARALALQEAILGKFFKLKAWIASSLEFGRKHGFCRTWWNGQDARVRPLWHIADVSDGERETAERGAWNTRIQGTAAEFTNASVAAVHQWIEDNFVPAKLVLTVYDSILLEVHHSAVDEVACNVRRIMTSWPSKGVPLEADVKTGRSWGELTPYNFEA